MMDFIAQQSDFLDDCWEPPETEYQPILDFESEIFDAVPHNDIALLTQKIKRSFLDYCRQGIMLEAVRRYRLYKQKYKDFPDYCKNALGRSPTYCHKIIQAAKICLELIKSKFKILPTSVAQALPLLKFAKVDVGGNRELEAKWQTVLDEFQPQTITAAKIQETLDENPEDRARQVRIGGKAYQLLQKKALVAGMTVSKYLENLIAGGEFPDDEPPDDEPLDEGIELTAEQEEICDRAEAFVAAKSARADLPSKSYQKAIKPIYRFSSHQLHSRLMSVAWFRQPKLPLPDKDDEADALALACYYFDHKDSPRRFLQIRDAAIVRIRELCLRLAHYNRLQSPIINRLRQDLAWQFPEVMNVKSVASLTGDVPLLWGWIAGYRKSVKYDRIYAVTVGSGLTDETRFAAKMLCDLQCQERILELELFGLVNSDLRFLSYRKVFARFGFGLRVQSLILSQIFPIENYFGDDGKPEIRIRKGRNSKKPTKRYLSERRFMKSLGLAPTREWSGDEKKKSRKSGSDICRTAFWQWVFTRIESGRSRLRNEIGDRLSGYLLEAKAQKQPIKLVRSRVAAKAARMLWRELVVEVLKNSEII